MSREEEISRLAIPPEAAAALVPDNASAILGGFTGVGATGSGRRREARRRLHAA
jgi:hypothetical protein